jgi:HK97 family phage portal protein
MANWLSRILPWPSRAAEAQYRPGPYFLSDGWLSASAGKYWNWWQSGHSLQPYSQSGAMVEACVSAYSQTIAMCPPDHWRKLDNGGRERVTTSALTRVMKRPNDYQSISDFLLNLTRSLYASGEAFGLAIRNSRFEIIEIHLMRRGKVGLGEDGSIFYELSGNEIIEQRLDLSGSFPARDVLHVKLHTPRHPLKGESPIMAAALDLAMSGAALNQQVAFYLNQARPSFIIETDPAHPLNKEQIQAASAEWNNKTQGENAGHTPFLNYGMKAKPVTTTAVDGQLAEILKMTQENVALAFRVPLQILGVGGTPFASTELLMQSWIANGLGFTLNHIEEAFGLLFALKGMPDEYLEFDTKALLRSAWREQIEGLARSVISGIHSSDEARGELDLAKTPGGYGDMPRVQQQVVPLSYGAQLQPPKPQPDPAPAPADQPSPNNPPQDGNADATKSLVPAYRAARLAA